MRLKPSLFQYDYLVLSKLAAAVQRLIPAPQTIAESRMALDIGADQSPYRPLLEASGYVVRTLDLTTETGADFAGTAEQTGLPPDGIDLIICTQVLEHVPNPWNAVREIRRVLKPGGHAILSMPHVWFYHPHPRDYWRMTPDGMRHLCEIGGLDCLALEAQGNSITGLFQVLNFLAYGALGRLGNPLYAISNGLALMTERLSRNDLFAVNFTCLARKPA